MANYLSSYLSRPQGTRTVKTAGSSQYPVIKRYTPYKSQQSRAISSPPISAPFSGQDLASALLQQKQISQASTPSSTFTDTYNYDPIQAKIQALGAQSVANAQTNASQLRNEAAINEGDPDLLRSLGFDENTITAASGNPQSLLAQLNLEYQNRQKQLAESMQAQNLFFSGEYQRNLSDLAKGQATGQSNLGQKLRDLLSGIDTGLLDSQELARQQALQSQLDSASVASTNDLYTQLLAELNPAPSTDQTLIGPGAFDAAQPLVGPGPIGFTEPNVTYKPLAPRPGYLSDVIPPRRRMF